MLCSLTPSFCSRPLVITVIASELQEQYAKAAQMALARFELNSSEVQVNVVDSKCDYTKAVAPLILRKDNIDVLVVEPKCREVACKVADFASEWHVPVVSPIPLKKTERKRSLILLSIEYKTYGLLLQKLFDHFKWNRAAFLTSPCEYLFVRRSLESAFVRHAFPWRLCSTLRGDEGVFNNSKMSLTNSWSTREFDRRPKLTKIDR